MKILVSANDPTRFSAPNIWLLRVLPLLKKMGIDPEIAFFHYKKEDFPVFQQAVSAGIKCHLIKFNHTEQNVCDILDLVTRTAPDIFVPNVNVASYYACRWIRQAGIQTVAVLRSDDAFYKDLIQNFIRQGGSWQVDAAVSVSEYLNNEVRKVSPAGFSSLACPSGTPFSENKVTDFDQELVITYTGRMVQEQKRMDEVIPAVVEILKKYVNFKAVFQGEGPLKEPGIEYIQKAGLANRFIMSGFTKPGMIHEQLLKSHVFLLLSDYEGLSTALLEAMACGVVPIVKKMKSGISEIVQHEETGLIIENRTDDLEKALKRLYNDKDLWKRLSENARNVVSRKYTTQKCAERWVSFLEQIHTPVDILNLPRLHPEEVILPVKQKTNRGIAVEDHRLPTQASGIPVLLVRSHEFNYSETFIEDHVNYLSNNLDVLFGFPFPRFLKGKGSVLDLAVEAEIRKYGSVNRGSLWSVYVRGLARFLENSNYKVVLAESGLMGSYVYEACELAKIPCVVHYHGADAFVENLIRHWQHHYMGKFKSAFRFVVVSKAMKNQLLQLGAPPERVILSPYGVEVNVRKQADPKHAPPWFLSVGRFTEKKAPHITLQAFAQVLRIVPDARLTMVGDGELLEHCRDWALNNGLEDAVEFAGVKTREEVSQMMSQCRAFVQHSVRASTGDCEGLPLAILEAGAHALPVVSTLHAGIPDAVKTEVNGILVEEGDVDGMARGMMRLARDASFARKLGSAFRKRVLEHYSREHSIRRLQEILLEAITAGPGIAQSGETEDADEIAKKLLDQISADRNNGPACLKYGTMLVQSGNLEDAYLVMKEAHRIGALPKESESLLGKMESHPDLNTDLIQAYHKRIGFGGFGKAEKPRRVLVYTNLLPPQELGGYGRTVWELCDGLIQRGHQVQILTADVPSLYKEPEPGYERVEKHVKRNLKLFGEWVDGDVVLINNQKKLKKIAFHNVDMLSKEVMEFEPDICMVGNLDFIGHPSVDRVLEMKIPVIHRLGNLVPGYLPEATPASSIYSIAGCSNWINEQLKEQGYNAKNFYVLHPGSPLKDYYRLFAPKFDKLRICYAGLMMAYKGPQVLIRALGFLRNIGIPFTCELAGDTKDPAFLAGLQELIRKEKVENNVKLLGFCNRRQLAALYARSNVMVFPSVFEEPFGKSRVEAQAAGLALVTSNTGGYEDILEDGINGLVFENKNAEDLARQLFILQGDPDLWARIASKGQQDSFRFDTNRSVERLEEQIEEMLLKQQDLVCYGS